MNEQEPQDAFQELRSRFVVGIDLGTTNCAVAFVDTEQAARDIQTFGVPQWVDFGTLERRDFLPSFVYQPLDEEKNRLAQGHEERPEYIVGGLARDRGLQLPGRQIASAKSWLCHDGVDRREAILPWQGDAEVEKLSPVEASARYLAQIRRTWDREFPDHRLADQEIVLTLPASFDQVARQLTVEAAAQAGLPRILPIEEPQAAFYAWLSRHQQNWESQVQPGQTILVCDIGGGTTDFTLIRVRTANQNANPNEETLDEARRQKLSLHRVAVGQHLILGGDNVDLALAKLAEAKISPGAALPPRTWDALRQACRVAKETLLARDAPDSFTMHLPGSGSQLIGGGRQVALTASEIDACVLEGFFPLGELADRPESQQTGFQEFGLPFASDPAITKHLSAFLWNHRHAGRDERETDKLSDLSAARPDWILFNGGVMTSRLLRERVVSAIARWFAGQEAVPSDWKPGVLVGEGMDKAVAVGAAYFGQVRRGEGVAIEAKLACSYYLQTALDPPQAVCMVPGSASPGDRFQLADMELELAIGRPVQFPLAYSSTRLSDDVGQTVELAEDHFTMLPPLRTVLEMSRSRTENTLPVQVEAELSEIGTLQVFCQSRESDHRWKLEFDVRPSTETEREPGSAPTTDSGLLEERVEQDARATLEQVFMPGGTVKPAKLIHGLTQVLGMNRSRWTPNLLRSIWASLVELQEGRRISPAHEARWLNLLGYALRPGYGLAADDWRVAQTWRMVHGKLAFGAASSRNESLILWRRVAGGFTTGQQLTVYQQIVGPVRGVLDPIRRAKGGSGTTPHELIELLRLLGSLELLPKSEKRQLGDWLLPLLNVKKWAPCTSAMLWALGRLGARVPAYGPLNCVVDLEVTTRWVDVLCQSDLDDPNVALAVMLCARKVDDRYRDVDPATRAGAARFLRARNAPEHYLQLVEQGGQLQTEEAEQVLGESLPFGLRLKT